MLPGPYAKACLALRQGLAEVFARAIDLVTAPAVKKPVSPPSNRGGEALDISAGMIDNTAAKYLWDVQQAALRITRFTSGRSFDDYLADEMLSAAVERPFEIIGDALGRLRRIVPEVASTIPDVHQIIGFRNVFVHAYGDVDSLEVWGNIQNELPQLLEPVSDLLSKPSRP